MVDLSKLEERDRNNSGRKVNKIMERGDGTDEYSIKQGKKGATRKSKPEQTAH